MNICILGLGVIGTTYAYALQKAGHNVAHFVRESKKEKKGQTINIQLLDGRENPKGIEQTDSYFIKLAQPDSNYDFIFLSLSMGKLEMAMKTLSDYNIKGNIILMCGMWEAVEQIDKIMEPYPYILGYPVAGGTITEDLLDCVLFDHIALESQENSSLSSSNYSALIKAFGDAKIKIETPHNMLEWIWVHMAVNAGLIATAAKYADSIDAPDGALKASERLMNSPEILSEAVLAVREAVKIVEARGVDLKKYKEDVNPFKIPSKIAGIVFKKMFAKNELTRRIMLLHNNAYDLIYICESVYDCGQQLKVKAPLFYANSQICLDKLKE